ncbi:MAG: glycoside hydrolase family 18 protein [Spirochaetales bacterium]|nr:glycoside hydrolase family 18 protein [Spirochaetales bacterium]
MSLGVLAGSCGLESVGVYVVPDAAPNNSSQMATTADEAVPANTNAESNTVGNSFEVTGYLPYYQIANVQPSIARYLTDLVFFSFAPTRDADFTRDVMTPSELAFLKEVKRRYGTRIILGLSEHRSQGALASICERKPLREKLAASLADYLLKQGFDGVDIDWEYPRSSENADFAALLQQIHSVFAPLGLRLTVAVSPSHPLSRAAYAAVDRIHVMAYDDWGRHSTLSEAADDIRAFEEQGASAAKLQLGVPFYGRGYREDGPSWNDAVSYRTLQARYSPGPAEDTVSGYYFNGIDTVREKARLAKAEGLAGVMVWEIGQDTTGRTSLLRAISQTRATFN